MGAILLLRLIFGLWALPISAKFPDTPLEKQVALWPPQADWAERVFVAPWMRYDALHYAHILRDGYDLRDGTAAFHPLFPLLGRALQPLGLSPGAALLAVSTIAALLLCLLLTRYAAKFHSDIPPESVAQLALGGLCGFILLAPYNESVFLCLAVGSVWAMRERRFYLAGFLGALAALTRQQGVILVLPLAWQFAGDWRARRVAWFHGFAILLVPLGYALFVAYRALTLGDVHLASAHNAFDAAWRIVVSSSAQKVMPGQKPALPWEVLASQWHLLTTTPGAYHLAIDLFLGGAMALVALLGWKHLHPTERGFALGITALSLCYQNGATQPLMALPRHMMLAFPLYLTLARWSAKTPARRRLTLEVAFVINLFLAAAYFRHGWVP